MISNLSVGHQHTFKGVKWYHEQENGSDCLLIAAGDSWTWGDSLGLSRAGEFDDYDHRTSHVYGNLLARQLDSDFINIGLPGYSNLVILEKLEQVLSSIDKSYQKIYVVVSLTESGRDLLEPFVDRKRQYNRIKRHDWPLFDELVAGSQLNFTAPKIYSDSSQCEPGQTAHLQHSLELHAALIQHAELELASILDTSEKFILEKLHKLLDRPDIIYRVGRCFTSWYNDSYTDYHILPEIWTNIIAKSGALPMYPEQVYVMSQMGIGPLIQWLEFMGIDAKESISHMVSSSLLAIDWLSRSPYNSQVATRHPKEQAHAWWAEYILSNLLESTK